MYPIRQRLRGQAGLLFWRLKTLPLPRLTLPLARALRRGEVVDARTDIVIEGFPASANTFAVAAFRLAQEPRYCRIAHHTHVPAQVIQATRLGLPALLLIREPVPAVLSAITRFRRPTPQVAQDFPGFVRWAWATGLRRWISFYQPLRPYRHGFVAATFGVVTSDFGSVIGRVNERFGTTFREFEHAEANLARIRGEIDAWERSIREDEDEVEWMMARPSSVREELKVALRDEYRRIPPTLRNQADAIFVELST